MMRGKSIIAALALAGCIEVNSSGAIIFDGGASEAAWAETLRQAGVDTKTLYVGKDGPYEFVTRAEAQAFVAQHQGQLAIFDGRLMQARQSGALDVVHWQRYMRSQACMPRSPSATCLNPRGGLPRTIVRCIGSSLNTLSRLTNGEIMRSTDYPWTRSGGWDHVTVVGRLSRVSSGSTTVGSGQDISSQSLADFGSPSAEPRGATFGFNVIELTNCRLATFKRRAVTSG